MRLSWNEVRSRAATFAEEWKEASYEKGETQSFYNDFFQVFDVQRRSVAHYEARVAKLDNRSGFIDLFWPGVLIVEQKSAGRDLRKAREQVDVYFDALPERDRPRFILLSDFQTFELYDLDEDEVVAFPLAELHKHVESFGFILGVQRRTFRDQDPANIEAAELVGRLHDALADAGHRGHDLERFLVRMVFCMFADDTGVFEPRDIFLDFIETRTSEDGVDLGPWLAQVFEVLDTPEDQRPSTLDEDLARFPYVNGDLFSGHLRTFSFDTAMRGALLAACRFDWSNISPAIFGALFQSVMNPAERRAQGAHYTTEKNILKVIEPLFMDDLRDATAETGQAVLDAAWESVVDVDQFYGIELGEFPARIAETALWMMDHIMNNRLSLEFGKTFVRIPLEKSPHIIHGDALETDWSGLLPPDECSFVFGNPPFVGAKYQTPEQREQVRQIAALRKSGGTLDYVAAWFIKAGEYVSGGDARIGFVATNSLTQGEQVAQLWPVLFGRCKLEIAFAHRTFAWGSDARGKAHVHVVILGLDRREAARAEKRLFSYPDINSDPEESTHAALSPYLFGAGGLSDPHLVVREESAPINGMSRLIIGSKPIDDGNYIFDAAEHAAFLVAEPEAAPYLRPYVGAREYLQGGERCILALHDTPPEVLAKLPRVRERIASVRAYREASKSAPTRKLAETPTLYHVNVIPGTPFLVIPEVSSERREYAPIGWLEPPTIPSNKLRLLANATLTDFALLTSAMHMAWTRYIGGRLKSDYQYSVGVNYNTFPMPPKDADLSKLEPFSQDVLDARAAHPSSTLANLYDPLLMPPNLRRAHQALDRAVDRLYKRGGFTSERERIEHLFMLYEKMQTPLELEVQNKSRRRRRN